MSNRFEQSMPPSIDDVYRGLPIGPLGLSPLIRPAHAERGRRPAVLAWHRITEVVRRVVRRLAERRRHLAGRRGATATGPVPARCCQHA
ncbi:MAG: hypothetical protein R3F54_11425 [Alphaproteobacteria bacterium]